LLALVATGDVQLEPAFIVITSRVPVPEVDDAYSRAIAPELKGSTSPSYPETLVDNEHEEKLLEHS
jgi:hypothetical protein